MGELHDQARSARLLRRRREWSVSCWLDGCQLYRRALGVQVSSLVQPRAGFVEGRFAARFRVSWRTAVRECLSRPRQCQQMIDATAAGRANTPRTPHRSFTGATRPAPKHLSGDRSRPRRTYSSNTADGRSPKSKCGPRRGPAPPMQPTSPNRPRTVTRIWRREALRRRRDKNYIKYP